MNKYDLSSLKVLGTVGEPINEEAWHWYNENVGKKNSPIIDTWWQTETGGIMISPIPYSTPTIPTFATLPMPGIQPVLMDENGKEIRGNSVEGRLAIKFPWPSIARTIYGNHERYRDTYFTAYPGTYFTGDGALRDTVGYYRITGRVDDVIIVSGHNLGTAPIEDAINEHPAVAESAIVGYPHDIKGNALYGYITLKETGETRNQDNLRKEINQLITDWVDAAGAVSATVGYKGYQHASCISVNHVVCHGIPGAPIPKAAGETISKNLEKRRDDDALLDGDIVNIDVTVIVDGWFGDTSRMYVAGKLPRKAERLIEVTHDALMRGIEAVKPGNTFGDIGHAIQGFVEAHRMSVVRDFCGHGLGRVFHAPPNVLHYGRPGTGAMLEPGMFFTIEPMVNLGRPETKTLADDWTAVTRV